MDGESEQRLGDLGEEALVDRLTAMVPRHPNVPVGPGDDCAVVKTDCSDTFELLKTDCVIEGVHFLPGTDPELVGRKAMNRVLSDIAAMGGNPGQALVTIATDSERDVAEVEGWFGGIVAAGEKFACSIAGGETARFPSTGAMLSISMSGHVRKENLVLRSGASLGDLIVVTGKLGGSFESGRHLSFTPRLEEIHWLIERAKPSSMMDLSDGLGSDLPRLVKASGLGYEIDFDQIPCHEGVSVENAISDGEDYELLLTMPEDRFAPVEESWRQTWSEVGLTPIGRVVETTENPLSAGWEHYRKE